MMNRSLLALLWWLSLSLTGAAAVIELRDKATVTAGSVIVLGDVADVQDADSRRSEQLRGLPLGPAPAAGRSLTVSYDDVRQKLQSRGENLVAVEFRGQRQVIVTSAAIKPEPSAKSVAVVSPVLARGPAAPAVSPRLVPPTAADTERVTTLLETVLKRSFKPAETGVAVDFACQVSPVDVTRLQKCRVEDVHFVSSPLRSDEPSTLTAWWLDPVTSERQEAMVTVSLSQRVQRLALRHAVPKGCVLRPDDLQWIDAGKDDAGLRLLGEALGMETTRSLRAGHALTDGDVAKVPLMRTNDIVTVVVRRPGISVRREFKALTSAALNETVSLVALNDPRLRIQATVTGYREATLSDTVSDAAPIEPVRYEERAVPQAPKTWSVR